MLLSCKNLHPSEIIEIYSEKMIQFCEYLVVEVFGDLAPYEVMEELLPFLSSCSYCCPFILIVDVIFCI